jgi:hypothetical protein
VNGIESDGFAIGHEVWALKERRISADCKPAEAVVFFSKGKL